MQRKDVLTTDNIYHIMSKSIAGYSIFNSDMEYKRMLQILRFFSYAGNPLKFSRFMTSPLVQKQGFEQAVRESTEESDKIETTARQRHLSLCQQLPQHLRSIF